jgi:hypothetical protein
MATNPNSMVQEALDAGEDGRCGDYGNRPHLCREFAAGSDPLCTMFGKACPPLMHSP